MIYLYGLIDAAAPDVTAAIADLPGVQSSPRAVGLGDWTLVVSDQDAAEILPKRRLLLAHTHVLEHMLPLGPVLPARFGMVGRDIQQAEAMVTTNATSITQAFNQIRSAVELSIRIAFPRQAALEATLAAHPALAVRRDALARNKSAGHFEIAQFGETLADELDRRRATAQTTLLGTLKPLVRDYVLQKPDADNVALRAAFLVDANAIADFEAAVQAATATLSFAPGADPTIQIIGPAPAYHFVRLILSPDPAETAA